MHHQGEFCTVTTPRCVPFEGEVMGMFPQVTVTPGKMNGLSRYVVPEGLMPEFVNVLEHYFDDDGNARPTKHTINADEWDPYAEVDVPWPEYQRWKASERRAYEQPQANPYLDPRAFEELLRQAAGRNYFRTPGGSLSPTLTPHQTLGVCQGAPHVVIRAAFRALAGVYHPDKPEGSTEKMQKLNAAFAAVKKAEGMPD
jgi:hypothetical protein